MMKKYKVFEKEKVVVNIGNINLILRKGSCQTLHKDKILIYHTNVRN